MIQFKLMPEGYGLNLNWKWMVISHQLWQHRFDKSRCFLQMDLKFTQFDNYKIKNCIHHLTFSIKFIFGKLEPTFRVTIKYLCNKKQSIFMTSPSYQLSHS